MTLNSLDVQNKSFNPQFRGFSKHEVDEFLDIVVRDYDEFAQTIKDQERELKSLRERVKYFDDMKDSLNKSIVVAQDAADNLREQAKGEADTMKINSEKESNEIIANAGKKSSLIIEAAKREAGFILNAASDDARKLVRDTDDLKRKMRLYHQRMTSVVENQLASMQSDDWAEIFRPTRDYAVNPEEKLQSIIEEHLESADETLAKTQAITPLTDKDIADATEEVKDTQEVAEAPQAPEVLTDSENADENSEETVEITESVEDSLTQTPTDSQATYEEFPELATQAPEASNSMDNQETIDLSELKN